MNRRRGSHHSSGGGRPRQYDRGEGGGDRPDRGGPRGGGRGSGGGHRRRTSFDSGNRRERIAVESGDLVLIDQFMLANPQFVSLYSEIVDEPTEKKVALIERFGGLVITLDPGTYRIDRDPYKFSILVHAEGGDPKESSAGSVAGTVFINTRCVAMIDRELLDDSSLLDKYQQLWFGGQDKACRDLLRDNGGAVRYGFSRFSDDLAVRVNRSNGIIQLTPSETVAEVAVS